MHSPHPFSAGLGASMTCRIMHRPALFSSSTAPPPLLVSLSDLLPVSSKLEKLADTFPDQEEHAHDLPGPASGPLLPQRRLPLRGVHPHRLVPTRPPLLHHQAVSVYQHATSLAFCPPPPVSAGRNAPLYPPAFGIIFGPSVDSFGLLVDSIIDVVGAVYALHFLGVIERV